MVMFDIRGNELFLCIFFAKNHGTDLVQKYILWKMLEL